MTNYYSFLSEVMRSSVWMMHPDIFLYYKEILTLGRIGGEFPEVKWDAKREEGSLLLFRPGKREPETRLIQTQNPHWYSSEDIAKDDQIIHVLPVSGPITHGGAECSYGTREMADRFIYSDNQDCVIGHLVLLDTPGGSATANDLDSVFANAKKPVVGLIRGMNASKGVWISSFIPHVFAEREDVEIGCVGALWAMRGIRNGVNDRNEVYYEVYADNSIHKNNEYREAIQNDNVQPAIDALNEIEADFRATVKRRWPNVPDEKLTGKIYKASEVIGEMVDGIKTYGEAVNFLFELAGVDRKQSGVVTRVGVIGTEEAIPVTPENEITQSATGTEEPVQNNNTNPQKLIIPMINKETLEAIPGMGAVAVDEAGNASLTAEQYDILSEHLAKGNAAMRLASTQQETIEGLRQQVSTKDNAIKELSEATGKDIEQPVVTEDPDLDSSASQTSILNGVTNPAEKFNLVSQKAKQMGLI